MHYTIDYKNMFSEQKEVRAVEDIKDYLGDKYEHFRNIMVKDGTPPADTFWMACAMIGIQGYPVTAWYKHLYGVEMPTDERGDEQS